MTSLQITWFVLLATLFAIYTILDGYDLGIGFWHLFAAKKEDRKTLLATILPYWDGNEVWLLAGGGALFAAFPAVYAAVFSGFYLALMLVLWALIIRAVCIEYHERVESEKARALCDLGFGLGSVVPGLLLGVALGNIVRGVPLNAAGDYAGTFFTLLNPFSLAMGIVGLAALATHGALYAGFKTKGDLQQRATRWAWTTWPIYAIGTLALLGWGWNAYPYLQTNYRNDSATWIAPGLCILAIAALPILLWARARIGAFIASAISLAAFIVTAAIGIFPNIVPASGAPNLSLTVANSSSEKTLRLMLWVALTGVPLVIIYTIFIYTMIAKKTTEEDRTY